MNRTAHKVTLHPIHLDQVRHDVAVAFRGDSDLILYHARPAASHQMALHTAKCIIREAHTLNMQCYRVKYDGPDGTVVIGFTVLFKDPVPTLYSFGINPQYRKPEILQHWMAAINDKLGPIWVVHLYSKNTRAIQFLQRNGLEINKQKPTK